MIKNNYSTSNVPEYMLTLQIDGITVSVPSGTNLLETAAKAGIKVPTLCYSNLLGAAKSACMVCVVDVKGVGLVPACATSAVDGWQISTTSPTVIQARKRAISAFLDDHYADCIAPCTSACPAGVDVQSYLKLIALGLPEEAAALIRETNPFPAVHGRVCTAPCEEACRRRKVDEPVAIRLAKRFAAYREIQSAGLPPIPEVEPTGRRVAIVGAGPAGLTCAYYLARAGEVVTVYEASSHPGGMLRYGIPRYRLPQNILDQEIDYILKHGVELVTGKTFGKDFTFHDLKSWGYEAVFLAIGAHLDQKMNIPGEYLPQVLSGISFLRSLEEGKKFELGNRVAVLGGGNTAIDAARSALRLGAKEVSILYRRSREQMPAHEAEISEAEEEGVRLVPLVNPVSIEQDGDDLVLNLIRMQLGKPDASGRPRPEPIPGSDYKERFSTLITAIGQKPESSFLEHIENLSLSRYGTVNVDELSQYTGISGVFAGGDLTTGAATAVEAVGAGRRAADAIHRYLNGETSLTDTAPFTIKKALNQEGVLEEEFMAVEHKPRQHSRYEPAEVRSKDFREVDCGFEESAAHAEVSRCLECGCKASHNCRLRDVATELELKAEEFPKNRRFLPIDHSHTVIEHDPNRCIACGQCVRVCQDVQGIGALALRYRLTTVGELPGLNNTRCESCGQCLNVCPTGALVARREIEPAQEIRTICPYCGVGCGLTLGTRGKHIVSVRGDEHNPVNRGLLCVKGRFGYDFVSHPDRLTKPLIKKNGKFEEISWQDAIKIVSDKFNEYTGSGHIGVIGSAKCTNEEMYVLQKFTRAVLGTNNIDHCARLCHAPTVAGLVTTFGGGAMTNPIEDVESAECIISIGSNTTETHPIIGLKIKKAVQNGSRLIVINPLWIDLCRYAHLWIQHRPGTDVALFSGIAKVIFDEGLYKEDFVREKCEGFEEYVESLKNVDLNDVSTITGIPVEKIVLVARIYAESKPSSILYAMGITQHSHGTDNVLSLANLTMLTGNLGEKGGGINPLRGQNNVQGACDMGVLPNVLPGYQPVASSEKRKMFEEAYQVNLPEKTGLAMTEMFKASLNGDIKALYIVGENPVMSEANSNKTVEAISKLEFLVVQDIFLNETALHADVVLPAASFAEKDGTFVNTERRIQRVRKALDPPGEAKTDLEIICKIAKGMEANGFSYSNITDVMSEITSLVPTWKGVSYERVENGGLCWPCTSIEDPGTPILYTEKFLRENGKAHFKPVTYMPSKENPDEEYPFVLTTGRDIYHYHTGTMTRRVEFLNSIRDREKARMNAKDAHRLKINKGDKIRVISRRGELITEADIVHGVPEGVIFMTFHFSEACANMLTNPELDPTSKTPQLKICAVRAERVEA